MWITKKQSTMSINNRNIYLSGVIGDPINHSRSPEIHNFWIKKNGLASYYIPLRVLKEDLEKKINYLKDLGFSGLNVTVPHKVDALRLADRVTEEARKVGATNTLYFESGEIIADNTDTFGFKNAILKNFPYYNFRKETVLIYGAGGAARAILSVFCDERAKEIRLINRTKERAIQLGAEFGNVAKIFKWENYHEAAAGVTTVVNTTSLGNSGIELFPHCLKGVSNKAKGIDLVYNPTETSFMKKAQKQNITCINGLDMLVYQAMPGFKRWFKEKPVYSEDLKELLLKSLVSN